MLVCTRLVCHDQVTKNTKIFDENEASLKIHKQDGDLRRNAQGWTNMRKMKKRFVDNLQHLLIVDLNFFFPVFNFIFMWNPKWGAVDLYRWRQIDRAPFPYLHLDAMNLGKLEFLRFFFFPSHFFCLNSSSVCWVLMYNVHFHFYFIIFSLWTNRIVRINKCVLEFAKRRIYCISAMTKCTRYDDVSRERGKMKSCVRTMCVRRIDVNALPHRPTSLCDARATGK